MPQEARHASPLPAPVPVDAWQRARRLDLAEWHLREAVARDALGHSDEAEYHLSAAQEFIELARGRRLANRELSADVLRFELQTEQERP